jgi:hypothetical protein
MFSNKEFYLKEYDERHSRKMKAIGFIGITTLTLFVIFFYGVGRWFWIAPQYSYYAF